MNHLDRIELLTKEEIEEIISLAKEYKNGKVSDFSNNHTALMFFENLLQMEDICYNLRSLVIIIFKIYCCNMY